MDKFAVVDLETTGNSANKGDRIIEIAIIIYQNGKIIDQYSQLINPEQHLSRFITYLTGITNEMVNDQPVFAEVAEKIHSLFDEVYFVAHNVPFDLGFLNYELKQAGFPAITQPIIDTVELSRILLPQSPSFKLVHLSDWLDLRHDDPHRALSDAYVTTKLLGHLLNKINQLPPLTVEQLLRLEPDLKSHLGDILKKTRTNGEQRLAYHEAYQLAYKPVEPLEKKNDKPLSSYGEFLDLFFSHESPLKETFPKYEHRKGQREMAEYVYHAFESNQHAMIEAGTGTGKTLAYLLATSYYAMQHNEKVIISTYLIQLQKQLLNQDWDKLKQVLPFDCQVSILKGRQHYLNLALFSQVLNEPSHNYDHVLTKAILLVWLTETNTGDIDEVQLPSSGYRLFKRISALNEFDLMSNETDQSISYYQLAKQNAENCDLLIINHSLLADYMLKEQDVFKRSSKIIVDEAHHLEQVVADRFGLKLDNLATHKKLKAVRIYIEQLSPLNNQYKAQLQQLVAFAIEENELFFRYIYTLADKNRKKVINKNDLGRFQYNIEAKDQQDWVIMIDMAERLQFALHDLIQLLDQIKTEGYDSTRKIHFLQELQIMKDLFKQYFNRDLSETSVRWVEIDRFGTQNAVYLYQQPVDADKLLKMHLFDQTKSVIMTSASLTVSDQFTFFKNQVGLSEDQEILERRLPSPYTFQNQVKLLIPNDFPIARYDDMDPFIEATCEAIFSLADMTNGRMLVLFNSYDLLKKAYHLLRSIFDDEYMLIAQGISSGSHERLKKNFQNFDRSILLGTNAFWEGLDIPGSDLSCVVIVRLPFDSPNHPIVKQKHKLIEDSGGNSFLEASLPNAVIRFKQGFGRLIRSQTDRGIIFICDDRLMTKNYGQAFIDSIPPVPIFYRRTNELLEVAGNWI